MNVKEKLVSSAHSFVREGAGEGQCKSSKGLVSLGGMGNVRFPNSLDTSRGASWLEKARGDWVCLHQLL